MVLVIIPAATALILEHQFGIGVILLGIHVIGPAQQGLLVRLDRPGPVLLLHGYIPQVVIIVGCIDIGSGGVLDLVQGLAGLLEIVLAIKRVRQVIGSRERCCVFHESLPVLDLAPLPIALLELAVAGADFPPVNLGFHR